MGSILLTSVGLIPICCAIFLLYKILRFGSREKHLPPGPPTVPILGNAHLIPSVDLDKKLKEWSDKYGRIFSLKIGAGTLIVLNDRRAVHDLLDKRSAIYSERPLDAHMRVALKENLAFMHATPEWRSQRKICSQNLSPRALDERVMHIQEAETCQLVHDLLTKPVHFFDHVKRATASTSSTVVFGFRAPTVDSPWASEVYEAMDLINLATEPGSYLPIEQFPILKLIPERWSSSKARANQCFDRTTAIWKAAFQLVKERRKHGDERDSIADRLLAGDIQADFPMTPQQLSNFLGALHQGAADTTAAIMLTHILHLATHPQFQEKARAELDRVCGDGRMPTWNDFKELPYINCIIKEGLRIRSVVPTGVPHRVNRDDWFDGYLIPKDATIFFPPYSIHRAFYPEPDTYDPDRYVNHPRLAMDYAGSPNYENRDHYAYGAGRRICPGIHLAERAQWRMVARLLWAFRIEPEVDEVTGEAVKLDITAYNDGFVKSPKEYKVRFVPRSEKHAEVIRRDFENVNEFLMKWE